MTFLRTASASLRLTARTASDFEYLHAQLLQRAHDNRDLLEFLLQIFLTLELPAEKFVVSKDGQVRVDFDQVLRIREFKMKQSLAVQAAYTNGAIGQPCLKP